MDISEVLSGFRAIDPDSEGPARKRATFEFAHRLGGGGDDLDAFIAGLPSALWKGGLASESLDNHFGVLLSSTLNGHHDADTFLASVVHALVLQLTYQGRHRPSPEVYVLGRGGDSAMGELGLVNSYGVPAYCLDEAYLAPVEPKRSGVTLSRGAFEALPAPRILDEIAKSDRTIGCLAFLGVGQNAGIDQAMVEDLRTLGSRTTAETFYLLAGQADKIAPLYTWIGRRHPQARVLPRFYWHVVDGADTFMGVLVISGLPSGLDLSEAVDDGKVSFAIRTLADVKADPTRVDVEEVLVRELERVRLQSPTIVSASAPIPEEVSTRISNHAAVRHLVLKLENGRVIDSRDRRHTTYVIASGRDEIIHDYQELGGGGFAASPYFAPEPEDGGPRMSPRRPRRPTQVVQGPCLLLTFHPTVHSFHSHFLLQCFPRIQLMTLMGVKDYSILAPFDLKKYQVDMLAIVGVDASRIVRMDPQCDYVAETLYVPKLLPAYFSPLYVEIYDEMIRRVCPEPVQPFRRIIISREVRTTWRNMFSFDAVAQVLIDEHGFELVSPDKLSIEDEIRLFREAKIVVGAEGAGLYNCCFMSPGSHVVCLADQDYVMPVVGSMAAVRGFGVSYVFGESFMADSDRSRPQGHANFIVDPARVSAVVAQIISGA